MKSVTMYVADDGALFNSEAECRSHEQLCQDTAAANEMLRNGATLMAALSRANMTRPWWDSGLSLEDKVILMRVTHETGFVIRHWQCCEMPIYRVHRIETDGRLLLGGDAGAGRGYCGFVSVQDLLRYARQTADSNA